MLDFLKVILVVAVIAGLIAHSVMASIAILLTGALLALLSFVVREKAYLKRIPPVIEQHSQELKIRRGQLTIEAGYGLIDDARWIKERTRFIEKVVRPTVRLPLKGRWLRNVETAIDKATDDFRANAIWTASSDDPIAYEREIASRLRDLGWDANPTQASGDQGIDVVATKNGKKLVVQCKLYSKPVGNAAVQEIIGGRLFERADLAAVVSNAAFTKSAMQLAKASDVFLLHHDQLAVLDVTESP